jgi:two-component system sensor histidine kinase BarA
LPVRDAEEALRITGGSLEVADMLLADLLGSLPDQLAAAADTLAREDWEALRALIHRIKGATAVCAVPALHHAVCELQQGARDNDAGHVRSSIDRVERERQRLVAEQETPAGVWTTC